MVNRVQSSVFAGGISDSEAAFPEVGEAELPGFQNWLEAPECRHRCTSGGQ